MELSPDLLRIAARRWAALEDDLAAASRLLRSAPPGGFGTAALEAAELLAAVAEELATLGAGAGAQADGLLLTARLAEDADATVAAALQGRDPG